MKKILKNFCDFKWIILHNLIEFRLNMYSCVSRSYRWRRGRSSKGCKWEGWSPKNWMHTRNNGPFSCSWPLTPPPYFPPCSLHRFVLDACLTRCKWHVHHLCEFLVRQKLSLHPKNQCHGIQNDIVNWNRARTFMEYIRKRSSSFSLFSE